MRQRIGMAIAAMTLLLVAACGGSAAVPSRGQSVSAASADPTTTQVVGPALTRHHLLQWGADCHFRDRAQVGGPYLVCFAEDLPAPDRAPLQAACSSLRLASAAAPVASIVLTFSEPQVVSLNCDQGVPSKTVNDWALSVQRPTWQWPPVNFAGVFVTVPVAGAMLPTDGHFLATCDGRPNSWVCQPLGQSQPGIELRDSINWYGGPGHPVSVEVVKPSVDVQVSRAYNSNGNQVVLRQLLADQQVLVRALDTADTSAGFVPIDSVAGCCER
jgi:hypothetical protein